MRFICVFFFLLIASSHENTLVRFQSYFEELYEWNVISKKELQSFAENLDKDILVNPIDCNPQRCSSLRLVHKETFDEYLLQNLDKMKMKLWVREFLKKTEKDHIQREETKEITRKLWKQTPQRIAVGDKFACAVNVENKAICWTDKSQSVPSPSSENVTQVSIGQTQTCVVEENGGGVKCIGNLEGKNAMASDLGPVFQVSSGAFAITVLEESGRLRCWGHDFYSLCKSFRSHFHRKKNNNRNTYERKILENSDFSTLC